MIKIVLGSTSALKKRAVEAAFSRLHLEADIFTYPAQSGVSKQPVGFEETFQGASERARGALAAVPGVEYAIGIESGIIPVLNEGYFDVCAVLILRPDGTESRGFGPGLRIPFWMESIALERQKDLGEIAQERQNGGEKDPQRYLSGGMIQRETGIEQAIIQTMVPFLQQEIYSQD